ncbi:helix-turn-helix domain-containing protein [Chloroflexota bacterium]
MSDKVVFTIPEVAELLGVSRNFGYELARRGEIPFVKLGSRIFVPKASLEKLLREDNGHERAR